MTLVSIFICWHLYLLDISNQENLYILLLLYVVIGDQKPSAKKVTLNLYLKWPLNYLLQVFTSLPHTCNEGQKIILLNLQFLRKTEIKLPEKNLVLAYRIPTVKKQIGLGSLGTKPTRDARSQVPSIWINLC